jgi:hypothetical protein
VRERLLHCSVVVGMHPDQATEPLVDFALRAKLPFAVVPCCVHAKKTPASGGGGGGGGGAGLHSSGVRTYEDFVDFLAAKSPLIKRAELAIGGRSTVLFVDKFP